MHTNAIESWLARMHHHAGQTGHPVDWRFHVQLQEPGQLETLYPELGGRIVRSPWTLSQWHRFFPALFRVCSEERIDVLHVHADLMSAPYLLAARFAGVPRLVVHVHNADEHIPVGSALKARVLRVIMRRICLALADRIVGISKHTLGTFLAGRPIDSARHRVHYYGIDPARFEAVEPRFVEFRRELALSDDALILLFPGRLTEVKNPLFAVDVLAELRAREPRAVAVFAGVGSLASAIVERARRLGIEHAIRVLGWRRDIPEIMSASDWFILPHVERPLEGFGIAVVEAQLAGLRLLLSTGVPEDPLLQSAVYSRLPLAAGATAWADAALDLLRQPAPSRANAAADLKQSPMDMDRALEGLMQLHA